jgi:dipeptidyl aminopeptidase/acylaminoacyl peptidase
VEFSPKGDVLAVADPDRNLLLFNWKTNELRLKVPNDKPASQISFSPDGRRVFYAGAVREVATGRVIYEIPGSDINTVFGPDGTRLFSATRNSARSSDLHVWDAATGELLCRVRVPGSVFSLHPDGYRIAVASNVDSSGSDYTTMWIVDARPVTPEIRDERDAQALVAHLFRQPLLKDEVVAHLRHSKTVSEPVRRKALALVQTLDAEADLLDEESRRVVDFAGDTPERYRRALAWARESVRQSPKYYPFQNRLGMALYRTGEYAEAAEVLRRSYQLLVDISPTGTTSRGALDLVFLAMTQHQLGQKDDARATLALARDPKINPIWVSPHFWREAEALIEGKGGEPKD